MHSYASTQLYRSGWAYLQNISFPNLLTVPFVCLHEMMDLLLQHCHYRVQLEAQDPTTLVIKANVVERSLELLSPSDQGTKLDCIKFGCTYYGTDRTEVAVLYNNGPDPISFVTVLEEEAEGMEAVSFAVI